MRIVQLNLAADPELTHPERLLDAYHTLTGWSDALTRAGATVHVVQRFTDATIERAGVTYEFVADGSSGVPPPWEVFPRVVSAVRQAEPDVVHINGLIFPGMLQALRDSLGPSRVIVLQDHSGALSDHTWWPRRVAGAVRWRRAFRHADACTFTARELASRWHGHGLPRNLPVLEIPEASTTLTPLSRVDARATTGLSGTPAILWVGRLNQNKDPLTVLIGLEAVLIELPGARVWMVVPASSPTESMQRRIAMSRMLCERVTIVGPVPHGEMASYYSAADIFVSGSHHEGSGYALIEAMACGVVPCVTDIPAHQALTGGCGALWPPGNAAACAAALRDVASRDLGVERVAVRNRFDQALTWSVIGCRTFDAYAELLAARRRGVR